ncbi:OTU domain-containing protein [Legionella tunisiensis]|uniref:hypothetical protein n=1 Tax=Legionella tunisiensis TaxID=1034944 RepID=UPI0002EB689A|nr:hypothetical protein [Legionella tunisiensis]
MITDFLSNPLGSSLYTAAAYKFRKEVKAKIEETHPELASLIEIQDYLGNFSEAEIYRVPGIHWAIDTYTTELAEGIAEEVTRLKQGDQPEEREELVEGIERDATELAKAEKDRTLKAIDDFFQQKVVAFFKRNKHEYLSAYLERLKNPRSWGTEEALNTIHRVIIADGPRYIEEEGRWEDTIQRPINFKIFYNGSPATLYNADENPDIILDNLGNNHWVSQIPAKKDLQILLIDKPDDATIKAILICSDEIDASLKTYLAKPLAASIQADKDKSQGKKLKQVWQLLLRP